jgi:hypothetical protein
MKCNEKLGLYLMDENHFISLHFSLWASRRLPCPIGRAYSACVNKAEA